MRSSSRVQACGLPLTLDCLARLAADAGSHREAARLFGGGRCASPIELAIVRFKVVDADYEHLASTTLRDRHGRQQFRRRLGRGSVAVH